MSDNNRNSTVYSDSDLRGIVVEPEQEESSPQDGVEKKSEGRLTLRKKILIASAAAVVVLVGGYFLYNAFLYEDTDDAQIVGHVMPLSARISGQVEQVNVIEGQMVHTGDVLVVIDQKDYQVTLDQATANLADAEANAASSHYNVPITTATAFSGLDSAQAGVTNGEAGVAAAEHNVE